MKRVILALAVVATMVSCISNEIVNQPDIAKIDFGADVLGGLSRVENPALTTANIDAFDVWAFMDEPSGIVFNQKRESKNANGKWYYDNAQYWFASHTYNLVALAPVDHSNIEVALANHPYIAPEGLGVVTFTNLDGTDDLIYAEQQVVTPATITAMAPVGLSFKHLLSKIRFTFKNCFNGQYESLVVSNIKMTAKNKAQIDLTRDLFSWTLDAAAQDVVLDFGDAGEAKNFGIGESASCDKHRMTIPADDKQQYLVTFTVSTYNGTVKGQDYPISVTIKDCEFKPGKQYNFKVELSGDAMGLHPIVFGQPEIEGWVSDTNPEQDRDLDL
jgi:hypothetical protein